MRQYNIIFALFIHYKSYLIFWISFCLYIFSFPFNSSLSFSIEHCLFCLFIFNLFKWKWKMLTCQLTEISWSWRSFHLILVSFQLYFNYPKSYFNHLFLVNNNNTDSMANSQIYDNRNCLHFNDKVVNRIFFWGEDFHSRDPNLLYMGKRHPIINCPGQYIGLSPVTYIVITIII